MLASNSQRKYFFALVRELNLDGEMAKNRAKQRFELEHFGDITREQISELIDLLNLKKLVKGGEKNGNK